MRISLNGDWRLTFFPETTGAPADPEGISRGGFDEIPAKVPGEAVLDLMRAGREPDPFYGENLYRYRKYEFCRWMYRRSFIAPEGEQRLNLHFEGVNTVAEVFVNGVSLGRCYNMFIPHDFDVTDRVRRGVENDVAVVIFSPVNEARKYDFPVSISSGEHTDEYAVLRMPPHSFGWDIMPRLLSAGLWRSVWLESVNGTRLTQTYYATADVTADGPAPRARLIYKYRFVTDAASLDSFSVRVTGRCGESVFSAEGPARFVSGEGEILVRDPRLWWPRGYGESALYDVTMELLRDGVVADAVQERIGLRVLDLEMNPAPGDEGEFLVKANGVPILCKGSNWVPLDALHSRDASRYEMAVGLWRDMGCNILRCWGGNVYEDDRFYELCDEAGIMVWQDFAMACSIYPQDEGFLRRIHDEAAAVIRRRRNHPCLLLWAGDNEVDEAYHWKGYRRGSNRYNAVTREALPLAVRENDPYRAYLPSSPYIPDGLVRYSTPEQHNWGARAWYKDDEYKHTTAHFVSECGYHGCPDPESLREFLPSEELWPMTRGGTWTTHNTENKENTTRSYDRNDLMRRQLVSFCGEMPEDLEAFALLSQFSQAEAVKFFVERTRIKKWRRTGLIWWNMLDGWPQISDAVVDWYGRKKLAYTWLKRVHRPVCLMADEVVGWKQRIVLGNDSRESGSVSWCVSDADTGETLLSGAALSPANENLTVGELDVIPGARRLLLLEWTWDGRKYRNHYLCGFSPFPKEDLLRWAEMLLHLEDKS